MGFTVLLSVYYKEDPGCLRESLESILNQTLKPTEIVLVKDGPLTNQLNEVINSFNNKNKNLFKIISLEKNKGLGKALNIGLYHCKNNIVARMDTDDISKKDRFKKQYNFLQNNKEISVVGSWVDEFNNNISNVTNIKKVPKTHKEIVSYAKKRNPLNHPTVMFRKKDVIDAGGYKDILWNEDYYLWVRMILKGYKIFNFQESLLFFRTNEKTYERRGGFNYALKDIELQNIFYKKGFINMYEFIRNILIRCLMRLVPNKVRGFIYKKVLRK